VQRIALLPLNAIVSLPKEIRSGAKPVYDELAAYLEAQGPRVEHLSLAEARRRWREASASARETGSNDAESILARDLGESLEFDALLMPSLIVHLVEVADNSGTWNGVRRRVVMVNLPSRDSSVSGDTFTKGVAAGGISGSVMACSLHIRAFSRDGQLVFEGWGGFDFTQLADMSGAYRFRFELRRKPRLLRDPEILREGVGIALGPYLSPGVGR
jgi:hypothetical protein